MSGDKGTVRAKKRSKRRDKNKPSQSARQEKKEERSSYDDFDRLTGVKHDTETTDRYTYEYGSNGAVAEVTDNNLGRVARTDYDLADRPCQTELKDTAGNLIYRTTLKYDKLNNLQQFAERVGSETHPQLQS